MLPVKSISEDEIDIVGATLLSIEEAVKLPLRLSKYGKNWYWLRSPGISSISAASVYADGSVDFIGNYVDLSGGAVRPALQISILNSYSLKLGDKFVFGGKQFEIISDHLAFCLDGIGEHCFRKDRKAEDANDYEKSDVKKFVDDWFNGAIKNGC